MLCSIWKRYNVMKAVVTGSEMKRIDTYTIEKLGIPSLVLMERAAWSMVQRMLPYLDMSKSILCVCGSGNNGGDAVAVARILYGMGYDSSVFMAGSMEKWTEETKKQIEIARNIGVPEYNELDLNIFHVVVDGLFGIGLSSSVREPYSEIISQINQWRKQHSYASIWAVDLPSGLSSNTGQVLGEAVHADFTVTFGYMKRGMLLYPGRELSGRCFVEDIGFPEKSKNMNPVKGFHLETMDLKKLPKRHPDSNKGDYGKILVIAGSKNMSGAAFFAAKAAYTMGSGLVRILTPEANRMILQTQLPQAMISVWEEITTDALKDIIDWADAIVLGPGIGTEKQMEKRIANLLPLIKCPIIIDADGLNLLAMNEMWYDKLNTQIVLTPHMGEMARLTGKTITRLKMDRASEALEYAFRHQVICALKDSSTVISDGDRICFNQTGNHGMATGGSGDVLSGIIAALLGMKMDAFEAACMGVYIHGCAGDRASKHYGTFSMTSIEIIEGLIEILKETKN